MVIDLTVNPIRVQSRIGFKFPPGGLLLLAVHREDYKLMLAHLREARQKAGLSQRAVAARLGKPQSYIHKWECGQRQLNVIDLRDLCCALDISFIEFIMHLDKEIEELRESEN